MPARGRKPKVTALKALQGNRGKRPLDADKAKPKKSHRTTPMEPLTKLTKAQQAIWDRCIEPLWWLQDPYDVPKATTYVILKAKQMSKRSRADMTQAEHDRIIRLEGDLLLDIRERERAGINLEAEGDSVESFFD